MAFLQIQSNNPQLSFLLRKNPQSGMLARELKQGTLFGWFSGKGDTTYNAYFRDAPNSVSYKAHPDQDFEYIDTSRYSSPQFVLNANSDLFHHVFSKTQE